MSTPVTLNGKTYSIPSPGDVDWADFTRWAVDATTAIDNAASGSLVTPVFNVKTYGAKGDGATDDTTAIANARSALALNGTTGGTLYFPAGTYKYTANLQFGVSTTQKNIRIAGDGVSSVLKPTGSFSTGPCVEFRNCDYWSVSEIKVDCSARTGTGDAILVDGCSFGNMVNTTIANSTRYGLNITQINGTNPPAYNYADFNVFSSNASANVVFEAGTTGNVININSGARPGAPFLSVKDFGAVGDGTTDDTSALNAAFSAFAAGNGGQFLFIPTGNYVVSSSLIVPTGLGGTIMGAGRWNTKFLWNGTGGTDIFILAGRLNCTLQGFSIWGKSGSQKPRYALNFDYQQAHSEVHSGHSIRDITFGDGTNQAFTTCIYFDPSVGNNSEMYFNNVTIVGFSDYGIWLPGSQQKAITFQDCSVDGGWDGVDHTDTTNGGKVGVYAGGGMGGIGGAFQYIGGDVAACREAAFKITSTNDPRRIIQTQCEGNYQWLESVGSPSIGSSGLEIRSNRIDVALVQHAAAQVVVSGSGPYTIEGNQFFSSATPFPYIFIQTGGVLSGDIKNNAFLSQHDGGSITQMPVVIDQSAQGISYPYTKDNIVCDSSGAIAILPEWLTVNGDGPYVYPSGAGSGNVKYIHVQQTSPTRGQIKLFISAAKFNAAATSQTFDIFGALPKGCLLHSAKVYLYQAFAGSGFTAVDGTLGLSSSGNELINDIDLTVNGSYWGDDPMSLGSAWTESFSQGAVEIGADFFTAGHIYFTVTANQNLGNGSTSSFSSGYFFLLLDLEVPERYVYGV